MKKEKGLFTEKIKISNNRKKIYILSLTIILICVILFAITRGTYKIKVKDIIGIYKSHFFNTPGKFDDNAVSIVLNVRTPRIFMSALVGASLSLSGLLF